MKFQNKGAVLVQIAPLFIQVAPLFISQPHSQNHSMVPRPHFRRKRGSNIPRVSRTKWLHLQLEKVHESAKAILMTMFVCVCVCDSFSISRADASSGFVESPQHL